MGKEEEKGTHSLELGRGMDDNDQHRRGDSISCNYPIQGIAGNVSGFVSLRSRQGSEAADETPTAMSFKEMMNCYFARVKSKNTAKNDAALPTTTLRDLSEEQCKLQRREQRESGEVFGPGAIGTFFRIEPLFLLLYEPECLAAPT